MLLLIGSLLLFLARVSAQGPPEEQKFVAILTSAVDVCDDDASKALLDPSDLRVIMPNDSISFINGSVMFHKTITPKHTLELSVIKKENGQAKLVLSVCLNLCDEILNPESDYKFVLQFLDVAECPISGLHSLIMFLLDLEEMPINGSNQGDYTCKMSFYSDACGNNGKEFEGCMFMTFSIESVE